MTEKYQVRVQYDRNFDGRDSRESYFVRIVKHSFESEGGPSVRLGYEMRAAGLYGTWHKGSGGTDSHQMHVHDGGCNAWVTIVVTRNAPVAAEPPRQTSKSSSEDRSNSASTRKVDAPIQPPGPVKDSSRSRDLAKKSADLRQRGRFDEAMAVAQSATEMDPQNANAWWQLALAQIELKELRNARGALATTTRLAPEFAAGWASYGTVLSDLREDENAIIAFDVALHLGTTSERALRTLWKHYDNERDSDSQYKVLKRMDELELLTDAYSLCKLGNLHQQEGRSHDALAAYQRVAALGDPTGLFNSGLIYTQLEPPRDADAIDAWRLCLRKYPGYTPAKDWIVHTLPQAQLRWKPIRAAGTSPLSEDAWYSAYLNPFLLLNIATEIPLEDLDAKEILRAKKALLAEIDLEEGRIDWIEGLTIDRSRALAICDELNDPATRQAHWLVFQEPLLSRFLSRGEFELFAIDPKRSPLDIVERLQSPDKTFARWLSTRFSRQYSLVLGKALEARSVALIECLLSGRRWVEPEDEDACFETARRQVDALLQPLRDAAAQASQAKPSLSSLEAVVKATAAILNLLPAYFRDLQDAAVSAVRVISLAAHNKHRDSILARSVADLAKQFKFKSVALVAALDKDVETLDGMIKEQRKNEVRLISDNVIWEITKEGVGRGGQFMPVDSIQSVRWGISSDENGYYFLVAFDTDRAEISFQWRDNQDVSASQKLFGSLVDAAIAYVMPDLMQRTVEHLTHGKTMHIGPCRLSSRGIEYDVDGWFTKKQVTTPWKRAKVDLVSGKLVLFDTQVEKHKIFFDYRATRNAPLLHFLVATEMCQEFI